MTGLDNDLIVVHLDLVELLLNQEAELASVLGHEFAHLTLDHSVRKKQVATRINSRAMHQLFAGADFAETVNNARALQMMVSREAEREADAKGFAFAVKRAGYDPASYGNVVKRLKANQGERKASYLDSHPSLLERIGTSELLAVNQNYIDQAGVAAKHGRLPALRKITDAWLRAIPDSGTAWYYHAFLVLRTNSGPSRVTAAFEQSVDHYIQPSSLGSRAQDDDSEKDYAWLGLCFALFDEGLRQESLHCGTRLSQPEIQSKFLDETFGSNVIILGNPAQQNSSLWIARDASGSKLLTTDESIAESRGEYRAYPPEWKALRFPSQR